MRRLKSLLTPMLPQLLLLPMLLHTTGRAGNRQKHRFVVVYFTTYSYSLVGYLTVMLLRIFYGICR